MNERALKGEDVVYFYTRNKKIKELARQTEINQKNELMGSLKERLFNNKGKTKFFQEI